MGTMRTTGHGNGSAANVARFVVGLIWLAGAAFNALVTIRMADPYGWLEESPIPPYRWFFGEVASARPAFWTLLLAGWEATLAVLTLARGGRARLGLAGGAVFSAFLFSLASPYTLVMGPYALFLAWLARRDYRATLAGSLRSLLARRGKGGEPLPA